MIEIYKTILLVILLLIPITIADLDDGLIAYYKADNPAEFFDEISEIPEEVYGAVHTSQGKINGSYSFNGIDQYINLHEPLIPAMGDFSVNFWVNPANDRVQLIDQYLPDTEGRFVITINHGKQFVSQKSSGAVIELEGISDIIFNTWHMYTLTKDSDLYSIYFNGSLENRLQKQPIPILQVNTLLGTTLLPNDFFNGKLDEIGFWHRALDDGGCQVGEVCGGEIAQLYNNGEGLTYPFGPVEEPIDPRLEEFAPVFYMHPDEYYEFREIASLMDFSDLRRTEYMIDTAPTTIAEITGPLIMTDYYMDMQDVDVNDPYPLAPQDFSGHEFKVYGRAYEDPEGFTELQYFIFYPFQNWLTMNHEGDWELVTVTLNSLDEIHSVSYYFNIFQEVYHDTDKITLVEETHPAVYVGKGSHNNYGSMEPHLLPLEPPEEYEFWFELFWGLKSLDKLSEDGLVLKPQGVAEPGEVYSIEQISDATGWINYDGGWGQKTLYPLRSGPKGPKFSDRFYYEWLIPYGLSTLPEIPFMGVMLYSPVDITLSDESGPIDKTYQDLLLYTGENEPEAVFVKGLKDYTLDLSATEEGEFTLVIYLFDGEKGMMLTYIGIPVETGQIGSLSLSPDSGFVMTFDGKEYLPDDVILYNEFEHGLADSDGNGVLDFEDPLYLYKKAYDAVSQGPVNIKTRVARNLLSQIIHDRYWTRPTKVCSIRILALSNAVLRLLDDPYAARLVDRASHLVEAKYIYKCSCFAKSDECSSYRVGLCRAAARLSCWKEGPHDCWDRYRPEED